MKRSHEPAATIDDDDEKDDEVNTWVDVTAMLNDTCNNELSLGQMIHHPIEFNLMNVMQAMEMMDPKMDQTMIMMKNHSESTLNIKTINQHLSHNCIPHSSELSVEEVIRLMDELLCAEMSWFNGHALPQTVFTCVYLSDETYLDQQLNQLSSQQSQSQQSSQKKSLLLRCIIYYIKCMLKTIDELRSVMERTECREEEEFTYNPLGCYLSGNDSPKRILLEMNQLEKKLNDCIHHYSTHHLEYDAYFDSIVYPLNNTTTPNNTPNNADEHDKRREYEVLMLKSLLSRISYCNSFYHMHYHSHDPSNVDYSLIKKHVLNCKKSYRTMIETRNQLNSSTSTTTTYSFFDTFLINKYSSPTPLKAVELLSFNNELHSQVNDYVSQMDRLFTNLHRLKVASATLPPVAKSSNNDQDSNTVGTRLQVSQVSGCTVMMDLLQFVKQFSESNPHVLIRCRLMHLLVVNQKLLNGSCSFQAIIVKYLYHCVPCLTEYHREALSNWDSDQTMIAFIDYFANTLYRLCNEYSNNRSRLRRRLVGLFSDLAQLESKAENLDFDMASQHQIEMRPELFCLTFAVIDLICQAIEDYIKLGFELELYHYTEYKYVYWYLEYLTHVKILNTQRFYSNTDQFLPAKYLTSIQKKKIKSQKGGSKSQLDDISAIIEELNSSDKKGNNNKKKKTPATNNTSTTNKKKKNAAISGINVNPSAADKVEPYVVDPLKIQTERLMNEAQLVMCRGIVRTIAHLEHGHGFSLTANDLPFGNEQYNYERRFDVLHNLVQPPLKTYEDFKKSTDFLSQVSSDQFLLALLDHYSSISRMVDSALVGNASAYKLSSEQVNHLKAIQKVANTNRIGLTLAQKYKQGEEGTNPSSSMKKPTFDFSTICHYPVIKIPRQ